MVKLTLESDHLSHIKGSHHSNHLSQIPRLHQRDQLQQVKGLDITVITLPSLYNCVSWVTDVHQIVTDSYRSKTGTLDSIHMDVFVTTYS